MQRFLFLLMLLCLAACQTPPSPTPTPPHLTPTQPSTATAVPTASPSPSPTSTLLPSPTATATPPPNQRTRYHLAAAFDYTAHALTVQEQITYTNRADVPLTELVLVVEPIRWPGAFTLTSLAWGDGTPASYAWDVQRMILPLPQPLAPGETISLSLAYTLAIPPIPTDADRPVPFGYTERQTNLVDWYASIPPYQGGWLVNAPGYFGEHDVSESADFVVDMTLIDPPPGLVLAASAPALPMADGTHYEMQAARSFTLSASAQYEIASGVATLPDGRTVTVTHYGSSFVAHMAPQVISDTVRAVELFSELFAPYPHEQLSVVQADFLDGMEYDGLFFLSNGFYNTYAGRPDDYLTAIAVHETAHQWWYALIGNDQGQEPWLDEALSMYSEVLYYERVYPAALPAWWARRVDFYQPEGLIGLSIYDYPGFVPYRNAVYLRGALFLHELRRQIGDEAFFAFLNDYATRMSQQVAHADDFFTILAERTDVDIHDLQQAYFGP